MNDQARALKDLRSPIKGVVLCIMPTNEFGDKFLCDQFC